MTIKEWCLEHSFSSEDVIVAGTKKLLGKVVKGFVHRRGSVDCGADDIYDGLSGRIIAI